MGYATMAIKGQFSIDTETAVVGGILNEREMTR